jgi:hypothetical protein
MGGVGQDLLKLLGRKLQGRGVDLKLILEIPGPDNTIRIGRGKIMDTLHRSPLVKGDCLLAPKIKATASAI